MPIERVTYLLKKKFDKSASEAELKELADLLNNLTDKDINDSVQPLWDDYKSTISLPTETSDIILSKILSSHNEIIPTIPPKSSIKLWYRYAAAAAILFVFASTAYLFLNDEAPKTQKAITYKGDVAPGKDGAKLTLSDGRIILIDSIKDGLVAIDQKVKIYKEAGKIVYKGNTDENIFNIITTERGRQWSAILPDGTMAWLNASSSLRYPLQFSSTERIVEMTGEAAFNVVHDDTKPFRVKVGNSIIEDIGTEFNIKAYNDESTIKTSMIEGSARIITPNNSHLLIAGQASFINNQNHESTIGKADIDEATAWRKGLFSFKDANIQTVMKDIARWYNVEVKYEGIVSDMPDFTGKMGRNLTLAQTFKILSVMRVHFRIEEDKRVVIMP